MGGLLSRVPGVAGVFVDALDSVINARAAGVDDEVVAVPGRIVPLAHLLPGG